MTDKRVNVHSLKVKGPADKRVIVYAVRVLSPQPNKRVRVYSLQVKGPADGNRPAYWKDSGKLYSAEIWISDRASNSWIKIT